MQKRLLILAGGMSSRMKKQLTDDSTLSQETLAQANALPKGMIRLGKQQRPFLDYLLYNAAKAGVEEVLLLLNPNDESTQVYFENQQSLGKTWGMNIIFARQVIPEGRIKPLGTADAVEQALAQQTHWQNGLFIVCNSDNIYPVAVIKMLLDTEGNAMIDFDSAGISEAQVRNCAIIKKNETDFLTDLLEKPNDEEWTIIKNTMPRIGISWNIFQLVAEQALPFLQKTPLHPTRLEKELPNAVRLMIKEIPNVMLAIPVSETIPDLTSKADILEVQHFLDQNFGEL